MWSLLEVKCFQNHSLAHPPCPFDDEATFQNAPKSNFTINEQYENGNGSDKKGRADRGDTKIIQISPGECEHPNNLGMNRLTLAEFLSLALYTRICIFIGISPAEIIKCKDSFV